MTKEKKYKIGLISLGCDKNRTDAELMLSRLQASGYEICTVLADCDAVIVNSCGFIESARQESLATLNEVYVKKDKQKIILTGCLPKIIEKEQISQADLIVPIEQNENIVELVDSLLECKHQICEYEHRILTTPDSTAFLKIADGCNNHCSYCTIPKIRGNYKSTNMEKLLTEAENLAEKGVKELILVAQDVTRYGKDLYGDYKLVELIQKLSIIDGIKWIRLHYCYPELISNELIDEIANNEKVCNYIDMPLQHANDKILKSMFRRNTKQQALEIIEKLKAKNIAIRSTFIIGYPGETKKEFNELVDFIKLVRLDNVGFFAYSREKGTVAYDLDGQVDEKTKIKRLNKIQKIQTKILRSKQKHMKNKVITVLCEGYDEGLKLYLGRDERNSFDVDTLVAFYGDDIKVGNFYNIKIQTNLSIDLLGEKI